MEHSLRKKKRTRTPRRKETRPDARAAPRAPAPVSKERRRSERLSTRIPAILLGIDAAGREFFDRSEIVSLDSHGARMHTRFPIRPGTILEVRLTNELVTKRLRAVWQGEAGSLYEWLIGLEFEDPNEAWNLPMLRARWEVNS